MYEGLRRGRTILTRRPILTVFPCYFFYFRFRQLGKIGRGRIISSTVILWASIALQPWGQSAVGAKTRKIIASRACVGIEDGNTARSSTDQTSVIRHGSDNVKRLIFAIGAREINANEVLCAERCRSASTKLPATKEQLLHLSRVSTRQI